MEELTQTVKYTVKQYERRWGQHKDLFIDFYVNDRMEASIVINREYSKEELERFLYVYTLIHDKGMEEAREYIYNSEQMEIYELIDYNNRYLGDLKRRLQSYMGKDRFEKNYEKECYYLEFFSEITNQKELETLHISDEYTPLRALKEAHILATSNKNKEYRVLLSDKQTEVDKELLEYAIREY